MVGLEHSPELQPLCVRDVGLVLEKVNDPTVYRDLVKRYTVTMTSKLTQTGGHMVKALRRTPKVGELLACWIGSFGRTEWYTVRVLEVAPAVCRVQLPGGGVVRVSVAQLCE